MPIGKNALKRVENNGYANVKSTAPDMENSVVVEAEAPVEQPKKATKTTAGKAAGSVPAPKKTAEKKPETAKKPTTKTSAPKAKKTVGKPLEAAVPVGGELPYYLL